MKKKYIIPALDIVKVHTSTLMEGSQELTLGSDGSADAAESRSTTNTFSIWDDEEDY